MSDGAWMLARPVALIGLALPIAVIVLSLRRERPVVVPLGTARLFETSATEADAVPRRRLSAARWAAIVALVLGTLAAAAPRPAPADEMPRTYTAFVDRTPSMGLPHDPGRPDGPTRLDAAIESAQGWLAAEERGPILVEWRDASEPGSTRAPAASPSSPPPSDLVRVRAAPADEPIWPALDRQGALFVTDRLPRARRVAAGVFASGGPAVPGAVAVGPEGALVWAGDDDGALLPSSRDERPTVAVGASVALEIDALVRLWADERGVRVIDSMDGASLLVEAPAESAGEVPLVRAGRDGWSASFRPARERAALRGGRPWLIDEAGGLLVAHAPGRIDLLFAEMVREGGDDAEFAVSWAALLDEALRAPSFVVPLSERAAAGKPAVLEPLVPPAPDAADGERARRRATLGRWAELALASAAALAGLVALVLRVQGSP
ncbi:MAG: hypothetical protein AAGA20_17125 [Planctomycetota bacterium]